MDVSSLRGRWHSAARAANRPLPDLLSHYTSGIALHGILSSNHLLGGNYAFVNDRTEFLYSQNLLHAVLDRAAVQHFDPGADALIKTTKQLFHDSPPDLYIVCFCEASDLLSQWRGYARGTSRYCIEFKWQSLKPIAKFSGSNPVIHGPTPVIYDVDNQEQILTELIEEHLAALAREPEDSRPQFAARYADCLYDCVLPMLARFKDSVFAEEREWRYILVQEHRQILDDITFMAADGIMKPFRVMLEGLHERLPIDAIVIGDSPRTRQAEESARLMLERFGYSAPVKRSAVPLVV